MDKKSSKKKDQVQQDNLPEGEGAMLPNSEFDNVIKALMKVPPNPRVAKPKGKKKPA